MTFASTQRRSEENRISPVFWVLLATLGTSGWALTTGFGNVRFGIFLFVIAGWMVSLCLHEYAHARTALHGGDITIGAKGYLTLNPFKYAHAVLSFVMPVVFLMLGGIGLPGGAVFIERHRIQGRLKHSLISAAGPLVNLVFGLLLTVMVSGGWLDDGMSGITLDDYYFQVPPIQAALAFLAFLQLTAAILNLLPIPGLDGYGIIEPWLSLKTRRAVEPFAPYGMLALFVVIWQTRAGEFLTQAVIGIMNLFGVPGLYHELGGVAFKFWEMWGIHLGL